MRGVIASATIHSPTCGPVGAPAVRPVAPVAISSARLPLRAVAVGRTPRVGICCVSITTIRFLPAADLPPHFVRGPQDELHEVGRIALCDQIKWPGRFPIATAPSRRADGQRGTAGFLPSTLPQPRRRANPVSRGIGDTGHGATWHGSRVRRGDEQGGQAVDGALIQDELVAQSVRSPGRVLGRMPRAISASSARTDQPSLAARLASSRRRQWSGSVGSAFRCPFDSSQASISSIASSGRSSSRTVCARSLRLRPSRRASVVAVTLSSSSSAAIVRASSIRRGPGGRRSRSAPARSTAPCPGAGRRALESWRCRRSVTRASGVRRRPVRTRRPSVVGR